MILWLFSTEYFYFRDVYKAFMDDCNIQDVLTVQKAGRKDRPRQVSLGNLHRLVNYSTSLFI